MTPGRFRYSSVPLDVGQVQSALAFTAASIAYTRGLRVADVRAGAWEWARFVAWVADRPNHAPLGVELEVLECAC